MEIQNLTLSYGTRAVLRNVALTIEPGEFVFLIGNSGSGKTTFIKALIGDIQPKIGRVFDDRGNDVALYTNAQLAAYRRTIGIVFQDYKLLRARTVYENVAYAMEACGYPNRMIQNRVPEVLTQVGLLAKRDAFVETLSGGEAQRAAIARALIHEPDVILGDEPTGNLDPKNADEVVDILLRINAEGKTVIVATHDDRIVNRLKKRVIAFADGKVVSDTKEGQYIF